MAEDTCPVFRPTDEEFVNFRSYVELIERRCPGMSICKIIPPSTWKVRDIDIHSLKQSVACPVRQYVSGKHGVCQVELLEQRSLSVSAFYEQAQKSEYENSDYHQRERLFWKYLLGNSGFGVPIYGADVPGSLFDGTESHPAWNLNNLENLLQELPSTLPGVTTTMLYFGTWRALFAFHVEDIDLYSINYLHMGAAKSWYGIAPANRRRFEQMAEKFYPTEYSQCHQFLRHKTKIFSPQRLQEERIPYVTAVQRPGEFVITFPGSFHAGFNHGFNIAEATNFALYRWLDIGRQAYTCKCSPDSVTLDVNLLETLHIQEIVRCIKCRIEIPDWSKAILPPPPISSSSNNDCDYFFPEEKDIVQMDLVREEMFYSDNLSSEIKDDTTSGKVGLDSLNYRLRCICHFEVRYCTPCTETNQNIFMFTSSDSQVNTNPPSILLDQERSNITSSDDSQSNDYFFEPTFIPDAQRPQQPQQSSHRNDIIDTEDEKLSQCITCAMWFHPSCVRFYYSLAENTLPGFNVDVVDIPMCHVCHTIELWLPKQKSKKKRKACNGTMLTATLSGSSSSKAKKKPRNSPPIAAITLPSSITADAAPCNIFPPTLLPLPEEVIPSVLVKTKVAATANAKEDKPVSESVVVTENRAKRAWSTVPATILHWIPSEL